MLDSSLVLRPRSDVPKRALRAIRKLLDSREDADLSRQYLDLLRQGFSAPQAREGLARSQYSMPKPDSPVVIKDNPAYYLLDDAQEMLVLAEAAREKGDGAAERRYARHAVIGLLLGLEATINFVYVYSGARSSRKLQVLTARDKWLRASLECLPPQGRVHGTRRVKYQPGDAIATFSPTSPLFEQYEELKRMRDDLAHLKPTFRTCRAADVKRSLRRKDSYDLTRIPKDIGQWRVTHAKRVAKICRKLVRQLDRFMHGTARAATTAPQFVEYITTESS